MRLEPTNPAWSTQSTVQMLSENHLKWTCGVMHRQRPSVQPLLRASKVTSVIYVDRYLASLTDSVLLAKPLSLLSALAVCTYMYYVCAALCVIVVSWLGVQGECWLLSCLCPKEPGPCDAAVCQCGCQHRTELEED